MLQLVIVNVCHAFTLTSIQSVVKNIRAKYILFCGIFYRVNVYFAYIGSNELLCQSEYCLVWNADLNPRKYYE